MQLLVLLAKSSIMKKLLPLERPLQIEWALFSKG
jgi:hypothetical protein